MYLTSISSRKWQKKKGEYSLECEHATKLVQIWHVINYTLLSAHYETLSETQIDLGEDDCVV